MSIFVVVAPNRCRLLLTPQDGITAHILDVTDEAATDAMFESIGHADIIIANAGIAESAPLHRTSTEMWHRIMAVNLTGCFLTFRAGLQQLRNAKCSWGRLIAISSITGLSGHRYASAYSASKHGVNGLVRSTAAELASTWHHRKCAVSGISGHRNDRPQHRQYHCQDRQVA
jgi:NAD(P)-dependent dehydrogenase (short-subunit alcohol dehydrogenase family)